MISQKKNATTISTVSELYNTAKVVTKMSFLFFPLCRKLVFHHIYRKTNVE